MTTLRLLVSTLALWALLLLHSTAQSRSIGQWGVTSSSPRAFLSAARTQQNAARQLLFDLSVRGGGDDDEDDDTASATSQEQEEIANDNDDDLERYSRQVYTLGAQAHGRIRSSTVYLDGPASSGLLYECAKNLALSGVGHIVVLTNNSENDDNNNNKSYHVSELDDLGQAYQRAARAEVHHDDERNDGNEHHVLLMEYIERLNPNVRVSLQDRSDVFGSATVANNDDDGGREILLCVDRPSRIQVELNQLARNRRRAAAFCAVETAGVFGRTFCDFGSTFQVDDADGETPAVTPLDRLELLLEENNDEHEKDSSSTKILFTVHSVEGEKHDVSAGDVIQFQYRNGDMAPERCVVTQVHNPFRFQVELQDMEKDDDDAASSLSSFVARINQQAASFRRVKVPQIVSFAPLDEVLDQIAGTGDDDNAASLFAACDLEKSFDAVRRQTSMACFQALDRFVQQEGRQPTVNDFDLFWKLVVEKDESIAALLSGDDAGKQQAKQHCRVFLQGCAAKLGPFQAVFGAIASQETLKAATGLYFPVRQFLLYDCDEVLLPQGSGDDDADNESEVANPDGNDDGGVSSSCSSSSTTAGHRYLLGDTTVDALQDSRIFVVGAGAIGCELLKNLAAMGASTGSKGNIVLTDMDTIEKSNLSRQLLFRDRNIGDFKSSAAQQATLQFNPAMHIESHSSKVGGDEEHSPFDESFWSSKVDTVLNALDNVEARLYMDGQCVAHQKALVDAGTMGPKGNVQVVVPHQSESYASSVDPPEPAIPVCTLKNFPYAISHTIQWGRDLFDGLFNKRPDQANQFSSILSSASLESVGSRLLSEHGEESALETAIELSEDLNASAKGAVEGVRQGALTWASSLAVKFFFNAAQELLEKHPLDSVDEDGEPFWGGARRPPKALEFDTDSEDPEQVSINNQLVDFVRAAARLRVETLLGMSSKVSDSMFSSEEATDALGKQYSAAVQVPSESDPNQPVQDAILASLEGVSDTPKTPRQMTSLDFEKDDDSNGHVAFITAASNLRAICYGIPPVDAMETRRVSGQIVPAMITTTAFVSALSCIEFIKLTQRKALTSYRNAFINLALPFFAFTVPLPAEETPGIGGESYTLWDRIVMTESKKASRKGGMKMKSFLRRIKKMGGTVDPDNINVISVSYGPFMLFADFLHEDDDEVLEKSLWELATEAVQSSDEFDREFSRGEDGESGSTTETGEPVKIKSLDLVVVVEDEETGEEVELPPVRVDRFNDS